ncbi:MAG: FMN-binding protein [Defluviitaleaceae bacterium]|nr:FMN-binding protein [Defluviitaleaceae bacterium]
MRDIVRPAIALFAITAAFTLILAVTNMLTEDVIADAREQSRLAAMSYVLPDADVFSEDTITDNTMGVLSYAIGFDGNAEPVGVVVQMAVTGWAHMTFIVGIDLDGAVTGLDIISHAETPGLGARITREEYRYQFINQTGNINVITRGTPAENDVVAMASATVTMRVVADGVNEALEFVNEYVLPNIRQ